jgi:general stress protein YciG
MDTSFAPPSKSPASNDETRDVEAPRPRGFAALSVEERRRLGSKGGTTAHARGSANRFTTESASLAGRKPHENGTAHKWTSEEAREAGRRGGSASRRPKLVEVDAAAKPAT